MKKRLLIVLALLVLGAAGGGAWWRFRHRQDPMELAQAALQSGDIRTAALQYRAAVRTQPNNATAHLRLGTTLLQLGDPVAAEKELRVAQSLGANPPDMVVMLSQAYLAQGHNKELLAEFQPPLSTTDLTAQLLVSRALALASLHDPNAALEALQEAEQISPRSSSVPLTAARIAMGQQNLTLAATEVENALKIDPKRPDGLLLRAQILRTRGNRAAALSALDAVIALQPHYVAARIERANLQLELANDAKAREDVDDVLKAQPNSIPGVYLNAVLLARAKDYAAAEQQFQRLTNVIDRFPRGYFFESLVKYNLGQLEQARDFAQRYVTRVSNDPDGVKLLARIDLALKRPDLAIETLNRAGKAAVADSEIYDLLAQAYTAAGRTTEATQSTDRALALAPQAGQKLTSDDSVPLPKNLAQLSRPQTIDLSSLTNLSGHTDVTQATPTRDTSTAAAALSAISIGDLEGADAALAQMRAEEGNTETVGLLTAALMAMRQDYDGAHSQYDTLIKNFPTSLRARVGLAELLMMQGQGAPAEKILSDILAANPADEASLSAVLPLLLASGKLERAVRVMEDASKAAPDDKKIGLTLALLYLRGKQPDAALKEVDRVIGKGGQEATKAQLRLRAQALTALHRSGDALEVYSRLLLKSPADIDVIREVVGLQVQAKNYLGARDAVQTALQTLPNSLPLYRILIGIDIAQGGDQMALNTISRLKGSAVGAEIAPVLSAEFDLYRHRYLDAADAFAIIYHQGLNGSGASAAASAYVLAGQSIAAEKILREYLETNPHDANALQQLSGIYLDNRDYNAATPLLESLLAERPDDVTALNNLAWVYAERQNSKAVPLARRAFTMRPSAETGDTLGWALTQTGDPKAALTLIAQSAQAMPNDPTVQYHYAVTLKFLGRTAEAAAVAEKVAAHNGSFPDQDNARRLAAELRSTR